MDVKITRINCLKALHVFAAMLPVDHETDREVLRIALDQSRRSSAYIFCCLRVPDKLQLAEVAFSEAYWEKANSRENLVIATQLQPVAWSSDGNPTTKQA
jgi:hypothetical protein